MCNSLWKEGGSGWELSGRKLSLVYLAEVAAASRTEITRQLPLQRGVSSELSNVDILTILKCHLRIVITNFNEMRTLSSGIEASNIDEFFGSEKSPSVQ
jgi:hypothetical protein